MEITCLFVCITGRSMRGNTGKQLHGYGLFKSDWAMYLGLSSLILLTLHLYSIQIPSGVQATTSVEDIVIASAILKSVTV